MRIETTLLKSLIYNETFTRRVLPFLKAEYFAGVDEKIFNIINKFYLDYNAPPSPEVIAIEVSNLRDATDREVEDCGKLLQEIHETKDELPNEDWLIKSSESFCQERALHNGVKKAMMIMDGKDKTHNKGAIPDILQKALAISFDTAIGHDFMEDADKRFEFYHRVEERIPFDLDFLNKITGGGTPRKTLNIIMAGTGIGKTIFLCHHAAACLAQNYKVLYITAEMAEERIAERIDANLLNVVLNDLHLIPKADFDRKISKLKEKVTKGKLIIKEYPTGVANVMHFRNLLDELALKKNFKPDIIFVDYLNIMSSFRIKPGANVNSYQYIKSIAEELRGLAVEYNLPVWSATQVNRTGFDNSDPGLGDTSESFGLPMTADFMGVLVGSEQMDALNQIMWKQLKNRYKDVNVDRKFVLGLDKTHMRFTNIDASEQNLIVPKVKEDETVPWEVSETAEKDKWAKTDKFVY